MTRTTEEKCFALTAAFEGGGYAALSGNFDGQGISFGFLQWNLGRGTLQPLLLAMQAAGPQAFRKACIQPNAFVGSPAYDHSAELLKVAGMSGPAAVAWAAARQDAGHRLQPHWVAVFKALAAEPGFQAVQRQRAEPYMATARRIVKTYGWKSERALALAFDIAVQMGSIGPGARARYLAATLGRGLGELAQLDAMAKAIAPQGGIWAGNVLARKRCIALGMGIVHGRSYHLERDFGITTGPIVA